MSAFIAGSPVKICRPGRKCDGWVGRFLNDDPATAGFAWVAFGLAGAVHAPPDERTFAQSAKAQHKLFPLSQIQPYAPAS